MLQKNFSMFVDQTETLYQTEFNDGRLIKVTEDWELSHVQSWKHKYPKQECSKGTEHWRNAWGEQVFQPQEHGA